ncbi:hypothetical protein [Kitasatospora sp. NPDC057223]|uniref:hypothetical protein n=1 Tax=Kitasatospora sp. NPDC057223 TaxID=3346055 RepID=UPI0036289C2E
MRSNSAAPRTLRAAVFAALVVLLAALGQVLVTGRPLPVTVLVVSGAAVFAVALALAGSGLGFGRIAAVFLPLQLGLSVLFDLAQATCHPGRSGSGLSASGLHAFEPLVCRGGSVGGFLLGHDGLGSGRAVPGGGAVPTMAGGLLLLLVHVTIALLAAFWLRRADAALTGLAEALRTLGDFLHSKAPTAARLLRLLTAGSPARPAARVLFPVSGRERAPASVVLLSPVARRGPPVLAPAC